MRSRRSSRPSWSRSVFTLRAAGSLSTTPVACVSCTVMFCPPTSEGPAAVVPAAGQHRRGGASSHCTAPRGTGRGTRVAHVDFRVVKLSLPGRRNRTEDVPDVQTGEELAKTTGKGRPTPKRNEAQGRRPGPPPPPPTTRKEAYRRQRENQGAGRSTARSAAAAGNEA